MTGADFPKELMRKMFHAGTLDLSADKADLEAFVRIFKGELEALIALDFATDLSNPEADRLFELADPTSRTSYELLAWKDRAAGLKVHRPIDAS
ncbi:MAG: hypothetical protein AAFR53_12040 [Pseudomonadota bacterium]